MQSNFLRGLGWTLRENDHRISSSESLGCSKVSSVLLKVIEGSLNSKLPTIWRGGKADEKQMKLSKVQRKKMQ